MGALCSRSSVGMRERCSKLFSAAHSPVFLWQSRRSRRLDVQVVGEERRGNDGNLEAGTRVDGTRRTNGSRRACGVRLLCARLQGHLGSAELSQVARISGSHFCTV